MTKRTNNSETENVDQNQSKAARAAKALDGVTIAFAKPIVLAEQGDETWIVKDEDLKKVLKDNGATCSKSIDGEVDIVIVGDEKYMRTKKDQTTNPWPESTKQLAIESEEKNTERKTPIKVVTMKEFLEQYPDLLSETHKVAKQLMFEKDTEARYIKAPTKDAVGNPTTGFTGFSKPTEEVAAEVAVA